MENIGNITNGKKARPITLMAVIAIVFLLLGSLLGYWIGYLNISEKLDKIGREVVTLREQIDTYSEIKNFSQNYVQSLAYGPSFSILYEQAKDSVVIVRGLKLEYDAFGKSYYVRTQGSGFVYNYSGIMVVITNYHVVQSAINISVTFSSGNGYPAKVLGSDPYADLAVLSVEAPLWEFKPLEIVSSSTLKVGDWVVAIGNPYGLAGSMSVGVVSALGRTLAGEFTGGYPIANIIQTTAPLNPGNSGGPLLNLEGKVVGITTAIVKDSQGLGFAVPSNTILREIASLIVNGSYDMHPWIGVAGVDMDYEIAKAMKVNVTYGWLITSVIKGSPAEKAGLRGGTKQVTIAGTTITIGGDIIVAINGTKILGIDTLSAYLEENTRPGQVVEITIVRGGRFMNITLTLGRRPPLPSK